MAYLNVRERRLEAKIAYVGPALAGKATNIRTLNGDSARGRASNMTESTGPNGGDLVSLEWTPLHMPRFNDCDLSVKVIAARGEVSEDRLGDLFEDIDGVVVVVDATPAAQEDNRRALSLVREVLRGKNDKDGPVRPVVVQVNKIDREDALAAADMRVDLETDAWPIVVASATRGDGVVETLEMALSSVLEAIKTSSPEPTDVKADHNPLLTALRQILRETVTEHMATLERETLARVTTQLNETLAAALTPRSDPTLVARLDRMEQTLALLGKGLERTIGDLAVVTASTTQVEGRVNEVHSLAIDGATRRDLATIEGRLREELGARSKSDREHLGSVAAVLRRTTEAALHEVKKQDSRETLAVLATALETIGEKSDAIRDAMTLLTPGAVAAASLPARIATLESALARVLRETFEPRLARIDDCVQVLHVDAGESFTRADARIGDIQNGLNELLDELKKRKKGWFS